jgi:hypothetical protein
MLLECWSNNRYRMRVRRRPPQVNGDGIDAQLDNETFGSPPLGFLDPNANPTPQGVDYRFSVGQLPLWAKKQMNTASSDDGAALGSNVRSLAVDLPKGRWAQRVQQGDGITVKSVYDSDEVIPFPSRTAGIDSDSGIPCGSGGGGGSGGSGGSGGRGETIVAKRVGIAESFAFHLSRTIQISNNSNSLHSFRFTLRADDDNAMIVDHFNEMLKFSNF